MTQEASSLSELSLHKERMLWEFNELMAEKLAAFEDDFMFMKPKAADCLVSLIHDIAIMEMKSRYPDFSLD